MVPSLSSSHRTEVYNPKTFFLHAALLGQSFLHCPIFLTAASRRSLDRFSVPMWPFILSDRLLIVDLVGHYPTNYLMRRKPLYYQIYLLLPLEDASLWSHAVLAVVSNCYPPVVGRLLTCYSPVRHYASKSKLPSAPFDLHVLSTPPAFVLSQDQTLTLKFIPYY